MTKSFSKIVLGMVALFVIGCGSGGDDGGAVATSSGTTLPVSVKTPTPTPDPDPDPVANLRVINMLGGLTGLELRIDGVTIDADFQLVEATDYIELDVATHTVTVLQGGNEIFTEQVALVEGDFKTVVLQGTTVVSTRATSDEFRAQTTEDIESLVLTDDTTPDPGQFNARLVNSTPEPNFDCTLFTNNNVQLLGPVNAFLASDYSAQNLNALLNATSLILFFESNSSTETFNFTQVQGGGTSVIQAIAQQIPAEGANATILTTYDNSGTQYLLIVVDDAADGNTSILSTDVNNG
jgi:hypothetical protein